MAQSVEINNEEVRQLEYEKEQYQEQIEKVQRDAL